MSTIAADLILLAYVKGLRKGGKHQKQFKEIQGGVAQKYRGERARYAHKEDHFRLHLQNRYKALLDGEMDQVQFYRAVKEDLYGYYVHMYLLGRRTIGRTDSTLSEEDRRILHGLHSQELKRFAGFMQDMAMNEGRMPYPRRLDLYALAGYRVYLRGAVMNIPFSNEMRFPWRRNPEAETCPLCFWKEEESKKRGGFTIEELDNEIGWPGEKGPGCPDLPWCYRACRCHLEPPSDYTKLKRTRPTAWSHMEKIRGNTQKGQPSDAPKRTVTFKRPRTKKRRSTGS